MGQANIVAQRYSSNGCARVIIISTRQGNSRAMHTTLDRSNMSWLLIRPQRTLQHSQRYPLTMHQSLVHSQRRHAIYITVMYIFETFRLGSLVALKVRFFFQLQGRVLCTLRDWPSLKSLGNKIELRLQRSTAAVILLFFLSVSV